MSHPTLEQFWNLGTTPPPPPIQNKTTSHAPCDVCHHKISGKGKKWGRRLLHFSCWKRVDNMWRFLHYRHRYGGPIARHLPHSVSEEETWPPSWEQLVKYLSHKKIVSDTKKTTCPPPHLLLPSIPSSENLPPISGTVPTKDPNPTVI